MPAFRVVAYAPPDPASTRQSTQGNLALASDPLTQTERAPISAVPQRREFPRRGPDEATVEDELVAEGYRVVSIHKIDRIARWRTRFRAEKIILYRHLSRYLRKSAPINLAPLFLPMFKPNSKFRDPCASFLKALENGQVHAAMATRPDVFSDWESNLVEIGYIAGGQAPEMLELLSGALRLENRISRWAKQLAIYPSIVLGGILVSAIVFYGVMFPKMLANTQLSPTESYPLYIQVVMAPYFLYSSLAGALTTSIVIAILAAGAFAAYVFIPSVQYAIEWLMLMRTGTFGQIIINGLQIRLLNVLSIVLDKGQQNRAYDILRGAAVGRVAARALDQVYAASEAGGRTWAHALLAGRPFFDDPTVARVISAEGAGATGAMIEELNDITEEKETDSDILFEDLKIKLNSTMILILGSIIGLMYFSLYALDQYFLTHAHGA